MKNTFRVSALEGDIEGAKLLQLSALQGTQCVATASVFWVGVEGKVPELCNLFVEESARRKGIAYALIQAAAQRIKGPLCLFVLRESPAYWLYRKAGFQEVGAHKEKENNVWMILAL
jgi:GNAT superfamily N-acetyltransferase